MSKQTSHLDLFRFLNDFFFVNYLRNWGRFLCLGIFKLARKRVGLWFSKFAEETSTRGSDRDGIHLSRGDMERVVTATFIACINLCHNVSSQDFIRTLIKPARLLR
jgi:hypothetical protein